MRYIAVLFILLLNPIDTFSCTSAVISGRATPDGRPILWKHRDSSCPRNAVRHFRGERYSFTGIVNADSTYSSQIWIGTNEVGFSIMNTASYNLLSEQDYKGEMDMEGLFMAEALGNCSTVDDFEEMLKSTNGSRGVEANFGVIDAGGGAAYFEAGPLEYVKYDAADPGEAPAGYLIRTNFSFAGDSTEGYGYIRYRTISDLFMREYFEEGNISVEFIILEATRCLKHSLLEVDLYDHPLPADSGDRRMIPLNDYIPRSSSVSSMVVQGIKPGEDPDLVVMWTIPGFPLVTPVFPLLNGNVDIPEILSTDQGETAPLNAHALRLKEKCFPISIGSGYRYMDLAVLLNEKGDGLLQQVMEIDRKTIREAEERLAGVRSKREDRDSFKLLYRSVEKRIELYFGVNSRTAAVGTDP
ncbi:MAG: hypothetical protein R6U43_08840 [Candidatus Krumholzibacteriales bacterium]